jgi:DNA-binding MarR family transcriptional regulator
MAASRDNKASTPRRSRRGSGAPAESPANDPGASLMRRPGVLIRRLHQVHSAMFQEEAALFGVTPVQYSLLTLLVDHPGTEQGAAAAGLRLDRFTTADVVRRLETAGLLRTTPGQDRRAKTLSLTPKGIRTFTAMRESVQRAHDRLVEPLPQRRRGAFLQMLQQLVDHHGVIGTPVPKLR